MSHPANHELETVKNTHITSTLRTLIQEELKSANQTFYKDPRTVVGEKIQAYRQDLARVTDKIK